MSQPPVSRSLHGAFIEQSIPEWLLEASPERRAELKDTPASLPSWYRLAAAAQRQALHTHTIASFTAQDRLDKAMAGLQDIDHFAEPLLVKALSEQYSVSLDVNKTFLHLRKPVELGILGIDVSSYDVLKLPLLQAALHNFEEAECEPGAFHESSGFLEVGASPDTFQPVTTSLTVEHFTRLCRSLDLGKQYQAYLKDYLYPKDAVASTVLQEKFETAQKTALRAAAELALLKQDIRHDDYRMILSVIDGEQRPKVGGKPVWFRDLRLMKHRMAGCVVFVISEQYRYSDELILYVPHDPQSPLKRYSGTALEDAFKQRFTARDSMRPNDGSPTVYQRFFSRFVAYADLPDYFSQLTEEVPDASLAHKAAAYTPLLNEVLNGFNPFSVFTGIRNLPPGSSSSRQANPDPYLGVGSVPRQGHGIWADNVDLWAYLFEQHRSRALANARAHAVPTEDADARARSQKFARLLNIGMLVLTAVSMFVPVLGELMLAVMAGQLLYGTFEGAVEWSEGDRRAAKAHLLEVAENLALLALTAGAAKGLGKLAGVKAPPQLENLEEVTLPNGQSRLWAPDLSGYEQAVALPASADSLGQYTVEGKTYIRLNDNVYETAWDSTAQRWQIVHPTDPHAYRPLLNHNRAGAWRHTLERPQSWDRLTLLRRMGPITDGLRDGQLLQAADMGGVDDGALRKMHLDNALPPPALSDALDLIKADLGVSQVLEQLEGARPINDSSLFTPSLITQMPRWPQGRIIEVFDGPQLTEPVVRYGAERRVPRSRRKAAVQISREDVLSGDLPKRVLAQLDEAEIITLLGAEPARVDALRPQEFSKQLVAFARTRQASILDSLYAGNRPVEPWVARLQRECPGLSPSAARTVLAQASGEEIVRLKSGMRVPLHLLEQGRWYAQQGRLGRAYAGLYLENAVTADSRYLALHTLEKLPGWAPDLRLEVREGSVRGQLLDAIGAEDAANRKCLVKRGQVYQAFDEHGETLNSMPAVGDNFYSSLMHALPDNARRDLGVPEVNQHASLQRKLIDYAVAHRPESAALVAGRSGKRSGFKPPQRIAANQVGYPLSGRGLGGADILDQLELRLRALYSYMSSDQARGYILRLMLDGRTERQIITLINNRMQEWRTLEATLNHWVEQGVQAPPGGVRAAIGRPGIARALMDSWQRAPMAELEPDTELNLYFDEPLPLLEANFSHVRSVRLGGYGLTDATLAQQLAYFPGVRTLRLSADSAQLRQLPPVLGTLEHLTSLSITRPPVADAFDANAAQLLSGMSRLRTLHLDGALDTSQTLDVSALTELRSLTLGRGLRAEFPPGALQLAHLERLDLRGLAIQTLPPSLFLPGQERIWRGLSLNWAQLQPAAFREAYRYVRARPGHLVDEAEMVGGFTLGQLQRMNFALSASVSRQGHTALLGALGFRLRSAFDGPAAQFDAIEALTAEHTQVTDDLEHWREAVSEEGERQQRATVARVLGERWFSDVLNRYQLEGRTDIDLAGFTLSELPVLPAGSFSTLRQLNLRGLRAPLEQVNSFISGFAELDYLDLSLSHLGNQPASALDVSGASRLTYLNLRASNLQTWPVGAEQLPHLQTLDLRATPITRLPASALENDRLVLGSNFYGATLDASSETALSQARARIEQARHLPAGALARFAMLEPIDLPARAESSIHVIASRLIPRPSALPTGEGAAWRRECLQQLRPDFSTSQLDLALSQWVEGVTDAAMDTRLHEWQQTFEDLTRELNGWSFIHPTSGEGWQISSQSRRIAASRVVEAWREGIARPAGPSTSTLDLNGLQVGDLPALSGDFSHVARLDLTGVRLTAEGANGFLRAFTRLRMLSLSGQALNTLPSALLDMQGLTRLELASIDLTDPEPLYPTLRQLTQLRILDLGYNNLRAFSVAHLPRMEELNLSQNLLQEWPEGVWQVEHLRSLNLSGNEITDVPAQALQDTRDELLPGIDLSENPELSPGSLQTLLRYANQRGRDQVMGISRQEMERGRVFGPGETAFDDSDVSSYGDASDGDDAEHISSGDTEAIPTQLEPWLASVPEQSVAEYRTLWRRMADEPDNEAFFHLLRRLQEGADFSKARADLTRRVWALLEAIDRSSELRQRVFIKAITHGTCADGRTLVFSDMEVAAFEFEALRDVPLEQEPQGRALLALARQMFRLEQVERLARAQFTPGSDEAEILLSYRVGLTDGWRDGLRLPGQPRYIRFIRPIRDPARANALREIQALETTDEFFNNLISRDYWVRHLEARHPEAFERLQREADARHQALEDRYDDASSDGYLRELGELEVQRGTERSGVLLALSRAEVTSLDNTAPDPNLPGPSRAMMGPERRGT